MAIRTTTAQRHSDKPILVFPTSELARQYCSGSGIEMGAAAHNPFDLEGAINVAPGDDLESYRAAEVDLCGEYAEIDIQAEAHDIPLEDSSQDYIISSHVVEHLPDPLSAFLEWNRLLKPAGIIFMIVPHRDAHLPDRERDISTVDEIEFAYQAQYTVDDFPDETIPRRGHYFVYTLERMVELIQHCNTKHDLNWEILETQERDDKVGNGFTLVARYNPPRPKRKGSRHKRKTAAQV